VTSSLFDTLDAIGKSARVSVASDEGYGERSRFEESAGNGMGDTAMGARGHDSVGCVTAASQAGAWTRRLLLVVTALTLVWLYAFVAESRADAFEVATGEAIEVVDADSSSPEDTTVTPPPEDTTTTPPPEDTTVTPPPEDTTTTHDPLGGLAGETSDGSTGSTLIPGAVLLSALPGAAPSGVGDGSESGRTPDQSGTRKSASPQPAPQPAPRSPRTPWPETPFGFGGAGGAFGGSAGGVGGAALGVLVAIIFVAFAQLLSSRFGLGKTPLHDAAPAFQLTRPG
jgi:hypothetical protein